MPEELKKLFAIDETANIMQEEHFGLVNGRLTVGVNHRSLMSFGGLWAPPYVSSDFHLALRINGERVGVSKYSWLPFAIQQEGEIDGVLLIGETILAADRPAIICSLTLKNPTSTHKKLSIQLEITGTLDKVDLWEFQRPKSSSPTENQSNPGQLLKLQGEAGIALAADFEGITWQDYASLCETSAELPAGEHKTFHLVLSVGNHVSAEKESREILQTAEQSIEASEARYVRLVEELYHKLPVLEASDPRLVKLYNRSLMHLLTNRWEVPEFILQPYYSTGSVKGGCVCNYLWDFGEVWKIFPLYDPAAAKSHVLQFLTIDITQHFSFNPMDGCALGPWYPANQEKIIGLIYYYVLHTGDVDFLQETVKSETVLDLVIANALQGDDISQPVALIDYGPANDHLELRREYCYNHVIPDLNGRRYANYLLASQLCELTGRPAPYLQERAEALKQLLPTLWEEQARWFHFLGANGPELRYTVQMFKLIGSGVLDKQMEADLVAHLNEAEFLSTYGLHSMAKTDPAYDQVDIDNGGGGCYVGFPAQIIEKLYQAGYPKEAEDILGRILWWGERMPYWGDSLVANYIDYRQDTPLQCALTGASVAQCIIFGLFGIQVSPQGEIIISPQPPEFSPTLALKGLHLRDKIIDIRVDEKHFEVISEGKTLSAKLGAEIILPA